MAAFVDTGFDATGALPDSGLSYKKGEPGSVCVTRGGKGTHGTGVRGVRREAGARALFLRHIEWFGWMIRRGCTGSSE